MRPLRKLYGRSKAVDFGPLALKAVREEMIDAGITRKRINQHVGRIGRMFAWGVSQELIPVTILHALKTFNWLRNIRPFVTDLRRAACDPPHSEDLLFPSSL